MITIDDVKLYLSWFEDDSESTPYPVEVTKNSIAGLAISQHKELEQLRNQSDRAFSMLELFGVPKTRARYVSLGIEVLVSRYDKEVHFLNAEISDLKMILREAERLANAEKGNLCARIIHMKDEIEGLRAELELANKFIDKAFEAHPNLPLDIAFLEKSGEPK